MKKFLYALYKLKRMVLFCNVCHLFKSALASHSRLQVFPPAATKTNINTNNPYPPGKNQDQPFSCKTSLLLCKNRTKLKFGSPYFCPLSFSTKSSVYVNTNLEEFYFCHALFQIFLKRFCSI